MGKLFIHLFFFFLHLIFIRFASIKSLKIHLLNDTELRSLINIKTYKHNSLFFVFFSSELAPLKNKNKICIKQVKGL